jgi:hypothetical protein
MFTGKIKCVKCQKLFGVRRDIYDQRVKEFGSEAILESSYRCRKCRKDYVDPNAKVNLTQTSPPIHNYTKPKKEYKPIIYVPSTCSKSFIEIVKESNNTCIYPNRYLDDGRICNNCHIYEDCTCSLKNLKKSKKTI